MGKLQSKFVTFVLWRDYSVDESSWVGVAKVKIIENVQMKTAKGLNKISPLP